MWEDFYAKHLPPKDLSHSNELLLEFIRNHMKKNNRIVLVTVS